MNKSEYIECGKIINTHGIKGAVKIDSWCDSPQILANAKALFFKNENGYEKTVVKHAWINKSFVIAELDLIKDLDTAIKFKERIVYMLRDDLPLDEGSYFIADLIDLPVIDQNTGEKYGILKDVINTGASDIYVINTDKGEKMLPAVEEFVKSIDLERGIYIVPIEGIFD